MTFWYDFRRYQRHSGTVANQNDRTVMRAVMTMNYHVLEKGLAMGAARPGFGLGVARDVARIVRQYVALYGADEYTGIAITVLSAYQAFNQKHGTEDPELGRQIGELKRHRTDIVREAGGVVEVTRAQIEAAGKRDLSEFFLSRHSVRHFSDEPVDTEVLRRAVRMAQKSPSVCNRQASRVWIYTDNADKLAILEKQNGNRGFTHEIGAVLIMTVDLRHFVTKQERNEAWVDGGMFAMSLVYALHSLGLGSCCLNWCQTEVEDKKLQRITGIPDHEVVIMMIAVGHLPDHFRVAQSPRKSLDEVCVIARCRQEDS